MTKLTNFSLKLSKTTDLLNRKFSLDITSLAINKVQKRFADLSFDSKK